MNEAFAFNLNHLRYFYEVARSGNMRRAASRIGISQPALSKQIQALEESIGLQLFYRSSRGLRPTPDGEAVFLHCERVFAHLRDLEEAVEALQSGSAGRVTVGATFSIAEYILPEYMRRYHERHSKVRFRLVTARSGQVLRSLREHRVDVAFVAGHPDDESLVATPIRDNRLVVVVGGGHELAGTSGPVPVERLHRINMIAFDEEAPTRKLTERYLDKRDVEPRIMAESPSIETIKRLVREGMGFAVLPLHSVGEDLAAGRLEIVDVAGWDLHRLLYIVHLALAALPPTVQNFVDLIPSIEAPPGLEIGHRGFAVTA